MATPISSSFLGFFLLTTLLVFLSSSKKLGFASAGRQKIESNNHLLHHHTHHTVEVSSLLPSTTCSPSTKGVYHTTLKSLSLSLSLSLSPPSYTHDLLISEEIKKIQIENLLGFVALSMNQLLIFQLQSMFCHLPNTVK